MSNINHEQCVSKLQGHLKGATATIQEIEELLMSQEHIIWQQAKEIEELRRRLQEFESLGFQNEQVQHLKNINVQLKTQIEFLRAEIQEKDEMIAQFTSKPVQAASPDILAAQQQLIQQNLQLQNIIGDLQNQILNKDAVIGQLKTQESTLDQLIGQLQSNIQSKRSKVGATQQGNEASNVLNELQQYPEALQDVIERIIQEYRRMQFLIEEKDIEIQNLKSRLQLQQQKANDSISEIKKRDISPKQSDQALDLAKQTATIDDMINDLERKLMSQDNRKKELEAKLLDVGIQNVELEKQLQQSKDQLPKTVDELVKANLDVNDKINELQKALIQKQNEKDQLQKQLNVSNDNQSQPNLNKQDNEKLNTSQGRNNIDDLVLENQKLEDLIAELQQKLVDKQAQKEEIENEIKKLNIPALQQDIKDLKKQHEILEADYQNQKKENQQLQDECNQNKEIQQKLQQENKELQDSNNQTQSQIKQQQDRLAQLQDQKNKNSNKLANDDFQKLQDKFNQTEENNKILEQLVQQLNEELKQQQQDNQPLQEELMDLKSKLQDTKENNSELAQQVQQLEEELNNLKKEQMPNKESAKPNYSKSVEQQRTTPVEKFREPFQSILDKEEFSFDLGSVNQQEVSSQEVTNTPENPKYTQFAKHKTQDGKLITIPLDIIKNYEYLIREKENEIDELKNELANQGLQSIPLNFQSGNMESNEQDNNNFQLQAQGTDQNYEQNPEDQGATIEQLQKKIRTKDDYIQMLLEQIEELKQFGTLSEEQQREKLEINQRKSDDLVKQNMEIADLIIDLESKLANRKIENEEIKKQLEAANKEYNDQQQRSKMYEVYMLNKELDEDISLSPQLTQEEPLYDNQQGLEQEKSEDLQRKPKMLTIKEKYEKKIKDLKRLNKKLMDQIKQLSEGQNQQIHIPQQEDDIKTKQVQKSVQNQDQSEQPQKSQQQPQTTQDLQQQYEKGLEKQTDLIQEVQALQDIIENLELKVQAKKEAKDELEAQLCALEKKTEARSQSSQLQESATMASTSKLDQETLQRQYDQEVQISRLKDLLTEKEKELAKLKDLVKEKENELQSYKEQIPSIQEYQNQQFLHSQEELVNTELRKDIQRLEDQLEAQIKLNKGLQQRMDNQHEQAAQLSQKIRESSLDSSSSNSQIRDNKQKLVEKQQKIDELVKEHLSLDDLIEELEQKLVAKNDYKDQLLSQLQEGTKQVQQPNQVQPNQLFLKQQNQGQMIEQIQELSDVQQVVSNFEDQISIPLQTGQILQELDGDSQKQDLKEPNPSEQESNQLHPARSQPVFTRADKEETEPKLQQVKSTQGFTSPQEFLVKEGIDGKKLQEVLDLLKSNNDVERRIQELRDALARKNKRKEQLEGVFNKDQELLGQRVSDSVNEKKQMQDQVHQKNLQIAALNEELSKLQQKIFEKEKAIDEKDREVRNSQLVKTYQDNCDRADELVRKNVEIEETLNNLEVKLAEKQQRLKEIQNHIGFDSSISNIQEAVENAGIIKSYDQEQDSQLQQQEQVLQGYSLSIDQLKNKIIQLNSELSDKDKINADLRNQVADLKKQIHGFQLAQQDVKVIKKQNQKLQDEIQALVQENLNYEDLIRDSEFKLQEKKSRAKELDMEIKNAEIQIQVEKQNKESQILQQRIQQTDELIKKNLELDEALKNLELRILDKQQQLSQKEARIPNQNSRILQQPMYIYQEDSDDKANNLKTEASPKTQHQHPLIQEHNDNLSELASSINQAQEQVRQMSLDDSEVEFYLQQKKEKQLEIEALKQQLYQQNEVMQDLKQEQIEMQQQIEQLQKENSNFDELVEELQQNQKQMIEQEIQKKDYNQPQEIGGPEQTEIIKTKSENLELSKKVQNLKQTQKQLKNQIANYDSLIIDLETVVEDKKNQIQRLNKDNQFYQQQNRKQKGRRDLLHKEQNNLQYQLKLLEPQLQELQQTEKQMQQQIAQLELNLQNLDDKKKQLEGQIKQKQEINSALELQLSTLNQDIGSQNEKKQLLESDLNQLRNENQGIEQEVKIYRNLNLEDITLSEQIDALTKQINDDKQTYETLQDEQKATQEQISLLLPQNKEIDELKESAKLQYAQNVEALNNLQQELQQKIEQKNKIFQEISETEKYVDENNHMLQDLNEKKANLEDQIKKDEVLVAAVASKSKRLAENLEAEKQNYNSLNAELEDFLKKKQVQEQELMKTLIEIQKMKAEQEQFQQLQQQCQNLKDQIGKCEQDIEINLKIIPEREEQLLQLQSIVEKKNDMLDAAQQEVDKLDKLLDEVQQKKESKEKELEDQIRLNENIENQLLENYQRERELKNQIDSIQLQDLDALLQDRIKQIRAQEGLIGEIQGYKDESQKLQEECNQLKQQNEEQENLNNDQRQELEFKLLEKNDIEQDLHSASAQLDEMKFQLEEKNDELTKLNDQFKKVDEESKMMEAVLQLKEKELKQLQKKKENLIDELERINNDVNEAQKQLTTKRKKQRSLGAEPQQQDEDMEEDIQDKITSLNSRNNNLKDDLQKLVEQSPDTTEKKAEEEQVNKGIPVSVSQFAQDKIQQALQDRDKKIEILEMTIQTLQQQQQEKNSIIPSMFQSKMSMQPSFFLDDDPILLELQEKFTKESELLKDLQNKIKQTAENHLGLSLQLKDWAEKENRLAKELDSRRQSVEQIEFELQAIFGKQSDLESQKVSVLQRIYELQDETQELNEQEGNARNKLKEKKDYLQTLYKNLIESDQKLLQLRNRMAIYSQEGRQLAEQVENLENEKENKLQYLQDIQSDLEHAEIEKNEKQTLVQSIAKEISETQQEKDRLEIQYATVHSKNQSLKNQIGFEESLYQKLLQELEIAKKRDQTKFQNLFSDGSTQTEYDLEQFEILCNNTQMFKIIKDDTFQLKENCKQRLIQIYTNENANIQQTISQNQHLKKMIHLQQMLIQIQENENINLIEYQSRRSSKFGFRSLDESIYIMKIELEQIDFMMNKTKLVEVQVSDHQIIVGDAKIAKQWIIDRQFDYDNSLYPLGVLNIIYKVSLYQVINISLTGTKVLNLYQSIL
ncbi:unnamed protein product (macronuclear) [Paramecium tetraurelia]|uniref:Uncharacterized protein n=1 Tax=Paramecium tetraurelia TaxID=5888 RepID=A0CIC5_PARTE|nr:uncharacterized protein GSPATT00007677001 [Paramecium tetraurelia]CAK70542.1 unnamed protein product [Paramecium tetraurelia]|eukprot:XP_001437939.1 hypothetical protein (macronuclear) [Paramecium tetraurelia strain d4-2]